MKVFFLTEYSRQIGYGHLSRCASLADAFDEKGYNVTFLIREWKDEELGLGHELKRVEWKDVKQIEALIPKNALIIFDSYRVSAEELNNVAAGFPFVVSISDSRKNFANKGIVIFGSVYGKELEVRTKVKVLGGPEFVLFRKIFWFRKKKEISQDLRNVIVNLGGHVPEEILKRVINILTNCFKQHNIKVLGNSNSGKIQDVKYLGFVSASDLVKEYEEADLVITNGGQSLNEAILIGIPAIGIAVAENQERNIQAWNELGVLQRYLDADTSSFESEFIQSLSEVKSVEMRRNITAKGNAVLDAKGAFRIIDYIENDWILNKKLEVKKCK